MKGALPDNYYSRLNLDTSKLASLLDVIDGIELTADKEQDIIGRVYEYFLSKFALKEGKGKGEFYTPKSIVNLIAELLEPYLGILYEDKSRYTDWASRDDIKANLQVDLIILLDKYGYPPVTIDDVYKEVLEQAKNFKKFADSYKAYVSMRKPKTETVDFSVKYGRINTRRMNYDSAKIR